MLPLSSLYIIFLQLHKPIQPNTFKIPVFLIKSIYKSDKRFSVKEFNFFTLVFMKNMILS